MTELTPSNAPLPRKPRHERHQDPPTRIRNLVYQVFPDRFSASSGDPLQQERPRDIHPHLWHAGGHLNGVRARIPYLQSLGVDAVYLTPIQPAPSNHKYDATSLLGVDERFGGIPALLGLADDLRQESMGLILDAVFNHVGSQHDWVKEVLLNPRSPRALWFRQDAHTPEGMAFWRGHRSLPELDTAQSPVIQHIVDDPDGPVQYWLNHGITGFRIDCANDLGWDFCRRITQATASRRNRDPSIGCDGVIGEVMAFAASFTRRGRLDGIMNYWFREAVLGWLSGNLPTSQVQGIFEVMFRQFHHRSLIRSWNILSSHDTPRIANILPLESQRLVAFGLQFFLPGIPVLYYGEEVGMSGGADPANRLPMDWSAVDCPSDNQPSLSTAIRLMANLRRRYPVVKQGRVQVCPSDVHSGVLSFVRYNPACPVDFAILVASGPETDPRKSQTIFVPCDGMFDGLPLVDALHSQPTTQLVAKAGTIRIPSMSPNSVALYVPDPKLKSGYTFFKPCWYPNSSDRRKESP
jgi:glycosidase